MCHTLDGLLAAVEILAAGGVHPAMADGGPGQAMPAAAEPVDAAGAAVEVARNALAAAEAERRRPTRPTTPRLTS